jgi:hypothetical protein
LYLYPTLLGYLSQEECHGGNENAYTILVAKAQMKINTAEFSCMWKDNVKDDLEIRYECVEGILEGFHEIWDASFSCIIARNSLTHCVILTFSRENQYQGVSLTFYRSLLHFCLLGQFVKCSSSIEEIHKDDSTFIRDEGFLCERAISYLTSLYYCISFFFLSE